MKKCIWYWYNVYKSLIINLEPILYIAPEKVDLFCKTCRVYNIPTLKLWIVICIVGFEQQAAELMLLEGYMNRYGRYFVKQFLC